MKIYWFGPKSISEIEDMPLDEAKKMWEKACFDARNLKSAFAGLFVIFLLVTANSYIGQMNFGDMAVTMFFQLIVLVIGLVLLAQMNFLVANYLVNQRLKPTQIKRF